MGAYTGFVQYISNPVKALLAENELSSDVIDGNSALAYLEFNGDIQEALGKDKESYDEYHFIENEYNAKQFGSNEELEKAKSTLKQAKFTILWNSICK
jgi:thiamine pyrophosphate-dependent acetolactate synthase large subunit-like protein